MMFQSAHDVLPASSAFARIGSVTFRLYYFISFVILDVIDFCVIWHLIDVTHVVLRQDNTFTLTKVMAILNDRTKSLPKYAHLPHHGPFQTTTNEIMGGNPGKLRSQAEQLPCCFLMGILA